MIAAPRPMGCARAGRCRDPRPAHTYDRTKYTTTEHVHSRGMNIRIARQKEREVQHFLSIWIDSRLPHIRNRVTQRLIWLLKIEGLIVGMLFVRRFPGLLAHWVFSATRDSERRQMASENLSRCYNKSYGLLELNIPFWWLTVSRGGGWRCKQV